MKGPPPFFMPGHQLCKPPQQRKSNQAVGASVGLPVARIKRHRMPGTGLGNPITHRHRLSACKSPPNLIIKVRAWHNRAAPPSAPEPVKILAHRHSSLPKGQFPPVVSRSRRERHIMLITGITIRRRRRTQASAPKPGQARVWHHPKRAAAYPTSTVKRRQRRAPALLAPLFLRGRAWHHPKRQAAGVITAVRHRRHRRQRPSPAPISIFYPKGTKHGRTPKIDWLSVAAQWRRRRFHVPPVILLPSKSRVRRHRVPGSGQTAAQIVRRHRLTACKAPINLLTVRRYKRLRSARLAPVSIPSRRARIKRILWPVPFWILPRVRRHKTPPNLFGAVSGPYYVVAGQLYVAGAVAGKVESW